MQDGFASPFAFVYNDNEEQLPFKVTEFKYVYNESGEDLCNITIRSENTGVIDHPTVQAHKRILVIWGYMGQTASPKRVLYILDREEDFNTEGVVLTLKCVPKAFYLKLTQRQSVGEDVTIDDASQ